MKWGGSFVWLNTEKLRTEKRENTAPPIRPTPLVWFFLGCRPIHCRLEPGYQVVFLRVTEEKANDVGDQVSV